MKTKLDPKLLKINVTHQHNHGPWAIVQIVDDEYVRLGDITKKGEIGSRAFLAWVPKLAPFLYVPSKDEPLQEKPFTDEQLGALDTLRKDLSDGKKKVVYTHIVDA